MNSVTHQHIQNVLEKAKSGDQDSVGELLGVYRDYLLGIAVARLDPRIRARCNPSDAADAGRKLGGILIETVSSGGQRLVVIGVGLNVLPLSISSLEASTGFACLQELQAGIGAPEVLARVALPLVDALHRFERSGFAAFADAFASRDVLFQRAITTTQADLPAGVAQGVSSTGALQVQTAQGMRLLSSGEVSVRPVAGAAPVPGTPC